MTSVEEQLEEAVAYARASEWPSPDEAFRRYVCNGISRVAGEGV